MTRRTMRVMLSSRPASNGTCVTPRPRISPMAAPPLTLGRRADGTLAASRRKGAPVMAASALPPLISSDGHLEVRPERWSPLMPEKHRDRAPKTIKLPDGGDALLVEGQPP